MEKKATIEMLQIICLEMAKAQTEHPKAKVYYDWESAEVRITYPLPLDYKYFTKNPGDIT